MAYEVGLLPWSVLGSFGAVVGRGVVCHGGFMSLGWVELGMGW